MLKALLMGGCTELSPDLGGVNLFQPQLCLGGAYTLLGSAIVEFHHQIWAELNLHASMTIVALLKLIFKKKNREKEIEREQTG